MTIVDRILMEAELEEGFGQQAGKFIQRAWIKARAPFRAYGMARKGRGVPLAGPGMAADTPFRTAFNPKVMNVVHGAKKVGEYGRKYGKYAAYGAGGLALAGMGAGLYQGGKRFTSDTQGYV